MQAAIGRCGRQGAASWARPKAQALRVERGALQIQRGTVPRLAGRDIQISEPAVAKPAKSALPGKDQRHRQVGRELDGGEGVAKAVIGKPLVFNPRPREKRRQ